MKAFAVLSTNCAGRRELFAEHGLSLFIRNGSNDYLFDTGAGSLFLENASFMNIKIENIKLTVLSHAHLDHIGGVPFLSRHFSMISAICSVFHPETVEMGQIPSLRSEIIKESLPVDTGCYIIFTSSVVENETIGEISMVVDKTLFCGCGHTGIEKIIAEVSKYSQITTIAGGFHNFEFNKEKMKKTAQNLYASGIRKIILLHCSSMNSIRYFEDAGIDCRVGCVGNSFNIE